MRLGRFPTVAQPAQQRHLSAAHHTVKAEQLNIPKRAKMAGNGETNGDLKAHQDSYEGFIGWLKFGTIATAIITAIVIYIIT
jgi:Bacterial aa3 type cytochrome c oxidase subunit IV